VEEVGDVVVNGVDGVENGNEVENVVSGKDVDEEEGDTGGSNIDAGGAVWLDFVNGWTSVGGGIAPNAP